VIDATGEQHDARAGHGGGGGEGVTQLGTDAGQRSDQPGPLGAEDLVGHPHHCRPVEQRVAEPGRGIGEVLRDAPRTVGERHHVDGVGGQPARRRRGADHTHPVARGRAERLAGHDTVAHEVARPVQVGEDPFQRSYPGHDIRGQGVERGPVEHDGDRIDAPRPAPAVAGGHVHLVDEVGGPRRRDHPVGLGLAAHERRAVADQAVEHVVGSERHRPRRFPDDAGRDEPFMTRGAGSDRG
jgi:hypothetical protein